MNYRKHCLLFIAFIAFGYANAVVAQRASSPVTAKLVVPDAKTLPGVPFDMWVEVRNASDASVGVGLCSSLLVKPEGGESFEARRVSDTFPLLLPNPNAPERPVDYILLAPGETKTLTLPVRDGLRAAEFFSDHRLSPPGRYRIALRLDYCWHDAIPQDALLPATFLGAVTTNEVAIERLEPTGADAAVWKEMQRVAHGKWSMDCTVTTRSADDAPDCRSSEGASIWNEILTKYPDSGYVPYAVLAGATTGAPHLKTVLDTIRRFPSSPVVELLHAKAWNATRSACGLKEVPTAGVCESEWQTLKQSTRPTTRLQVFGRDDAARAQ